MGLTEVLWDDHDVLRSKLALLEGLLPLAESAQFPLRDVTYSIARRLRCHMEKEEFLLETVSERSAEYMRTWPLLDEHQDQRLTAVLLLLLLLEHPPLPMDQIRLCATHLIDGLREHMTNEEASVFPVVEHAIGSGGAPDLLHHLQELAHRYYPEGEEPVQSRPTVEVDAGEV